MLASSVKESTYICKKHSTEKLGVFCFKIQRKESQFEQRINQCRRKTGTTVHLFFWRSERIGQGNQYGGCSFAGGRLAVETVSASYTTSSARWTANDEYSFIQVYRGKFLECKQHRTNGRGFSPLPHFLKGGMRDCLTGYQTSSAESATPSAPRCPAYGKPYREASGACS